MLGITKFANKASSWKTSLCAGIVFLGGVAEFAAHLSSIPATVAPILKDVAELALYVGGGLGLLFSRDNDKSSRDLKIE